MQISIAQIDVSYKNRDRNLNSVRSLLSSAETVGDVVLLPELFSTGYIFGLAICFDLWFPEIIREYAKAGIDVLLHPANFGGQQSHHISRARAIENSLYVVTCNRIGQDITEELTGEYCGGSQICTPSGDYLVKLDDEIALVTADIKIDDARAKKVIGVSLKDEIEMISDLLK